MAACRLVGPGDCVLTAYAAGCLYRYGNPPNLLVDPVTLTKLTNGV